MLQVPNYTVIAPYIPDLRFTTVQRTTHAADRNELRYTTTVTNAVQIDLPWAKVTPEWVEVYVDGFRLINPRITSESSITSVTMNTGGTVYEAFNVVGKTIFFNTPVTGDILVLQDTQAAHYYGAVILQPENHQAIIKSSNIANVVVLNTPIIGGSQRGFTVSIHYNVGPKFQVNSYVILRGNNPTSFNGNFKVVSSTPSGVTFRSNTSTIASIHKPGLINGFAEDNYWTKRISTSLHAEPVILTQPVHGSARLTTDRRGIAYVPDIFHVGNDTFSWTLITQHGQPGTPKCVYIDTKKL